jgi:hypothetical protein
MFPCWLLADGVARREPEQRATRWVGTYRTVSVSSPELVSSNLDQGNRILPLEGDANFLFSSLLLVEIADTKGK